MRTRRPGFTLVELLVVITIIGLLVGLVTPAILGALEAARKAECANKMRQIGIASIDYATRKGNFPGYLNPSLGASKPVSFHVALLKDLDRESVYNTWSGTSPTGDEPYLDIFICPSDNTAVGQTGSFNSFVVNAGKAGNAITSGANSREDGVCHDLTSANARSLKLGLTDFPDGADVTILMSENMDANKYVPTSTGANIENEIGMIWAATGTTPKRINQEKGTNTTPGLNLFARPSSNHSGSVNVVFASSQTRSIDEGIAPAVWNQLMTPNGPKAGTTTVLQEASY